MKNDDFWDYDRQVDLEAFNAPTVYDILSKQSRQVTRDLGKQKEEVKSLYQKIANQTESLKGLWSAKLNLQGHVGMVTEDELMAYDVKLEALEAELLRRKALGGRYQQVLLRMKDLMMQDERCREDHQVMYQDYSTTVVLKI